MVLHSITGKLEWGKVSAELVDDGEKFGYADRCTLSGAVDEVLIGVTELGGGRNSLRSGSLSGALRDRRVSSLRESGENSRVGKAKLNGLLLSQLL